MCAALRCAAVFQVIYCSAQAEQWSPCCIYITILRYSYISFWGEEIKHQSPVRLSRKGKKKRQTIDGGTERERIERRRPSRGRQAAAPPDSTQRGAHWGAGKKRDQQEINTNQIVNILCCVCVCCLGLCSRIHTHTEAAARSRTY